jgi:hypothetical protein
MDNLYKYSYNFVFLLIISILFILVGLAYPFALLHDRIRYG